jgi:succinate dehydrogenase / fumarate reductase cytochrome b subunit
MQDRSPLSYARSTLGLKVLMALTGVILFGFLVGHVAGNLLIFAGVNGPQKINEYSKFLHQSPAILWGTRVTLLLAVGVHIVVSIRLTKLKMDARPVPYLGKAPHGSSYASRTMMWSGPIIALFVVYHLLHFTTGHAHPSFDPENVFQNLVSGFRRPIVCVTYILAMLAVGLHLSHGLWSMLQTIGVNRPHWEPCLRKIAVVVSALIIAGFIAVPLAVWTGIVGGD